MVYYSDFRMTLKKCSLFVSRTNVWQETRFLFIPAKEIPNMGSKQFDFPITLLHFKGRQSAVTLIAFHKGFHKRCLHPRSLSQ